MKNWRRSLKNDSEKVNISVGTTCSTDGIDTEWWQQPLSRTAPIVLYLTQRDVYLGYFEFVQRLVAALVSGAILIITEEVMLVRSGFINTAHSSINGY